MLVVRNTSPLTNLAAIGHFEILQSLFGEIHIADGVWQELNAGGRPHPGSREVAAAAWVNRHSVSNPPLVNTLHRDLDFGRPRLSRLQSSSKQTSCLLTSAKVAVLLLDSV